MSKELPYFRFTVAEWQNGDISLEELDVQGLFVNVCAYYWINNCSIALAKLELRFRYHENLLKKLINSEIIKINKKGFCEIKFLDDQFDLLSEKRKLRQKAGKKGGKVKSSNAKAMLKQCSSYKDKDKDKDKDKRKIKEKFEKPSVDDVRGYCLYRGNNVDAECFYDFYESKGWRIGSNAMKNWKAAVRTWEKNESKKGNTNGPKTFGQMQDDELTRTMERTAELKAFAESLPDPRPEQPSLPNPSELWGPEQLEQG